MLMKSEKTRLAKIHDIWQSHVMTFLKNMGLVFRSKTCGSTWPKALLEKSNISIDENFVKQFSLTTSTTFVWNWNVFVSLTSLNDAVLNSPMLLLEQTIWSFALRDENARDWMTSIEFSLMVSDETLRFKKAEVSNRVMLFLWNSMSLILCRFVNAKEETFSMVENLI